MGMKDMTVIMKFMILMIVMESSNFSTDMYVEKATRVLNKILARYQLP